MSSHQKPKHEPKAEPVEKDMLDRLEEFFDEKVQPKMKEFEKLMKKDIELEDLKPEKLLEYNPDSPFSYLSAFLRDKAVASVAPSSKFLVDKMLERMDPGSCPIIVEFGPAEGVMTRRILHSMPENGTLLAVELNENFVKAVKRIRDPRLKVVHGDAFEIESHLLSAGIPAADCVVSGIPFSFFDPPKRLELAQSIHKVLSPQGRFVAFQYTTHLIPVLNKTFRDVDISLEVRNLPPALVMTAKK